MFAKIIEDSGASEDFAKAVIRLCGKKYAAFGIMGAIALLAYGGVSGFALILMSYPLLYSICKEGNIPRFYIPGMIYSSVASFAGCMFPGSPVYNNVVPTYTLGTTPMAAPLVGSICGIFCAAFTFLYFRREFAKCRKMGIHFEVQPSMAGAAKESEDSRLSGWWVLLPITVLMVVLNVIKWDVAVASTIASVTAVVMYRKQIPRLMETVNTGAVNCIPIVVSIGAVVGFAGVVKATSGFEYMVSLLTESGGNPLVSLGFATTLIAGATASGSGAVSIALSTLAERYLALGIAPEIIHRIVTMATVGFDSLPHNGGVVAVIGLAGYTHKEAYKPIFITTVVFTLLSLVLGIALGTMLYL